MELRWWPLGLAGVVVVLIVIAVAVWLPLPPAARMLRPLAHVKRLTELPSYRRVAALQFWSSVVTLVLLVVLFGATIFTSSRPVGFASATRNFDALHPEDVMVCVGEPVTDATTAGFLNYYTEQIKTYDTERIGLTSPTLRVVPLTRDYVYAGQKFADYAKLAGLKRDLDAKKQISDADVTALNSGIDNFSRPIDYTDYAQSTEDVLALCMAGFPSFEDKSTRRRSLIYLGYTTSVAVANSGRRCSPPNRSRTWPARPASRSTASRAPMWWAPSMQTIPWPRSPTPPVALSASTTRQAPRPVTAPTPPSRACWTRSTPTRPVWRCPAGPCSPNAPGTTPTCR
jgi:hypothetical protein